MSIQEWFDKRKEAQIERRTSEAKVENITFPGLWTKCVHCGAQITNKDLEENMMVCPQCDYHFRIGARERIKQLFDEDSIAFAKQLKELGIMPDKVGYEVISGNEEIIIELAWSDKRIAYLTADEAEHKMALQRLGWTVVQNVAEIKSLITGGK